MIEYILALVILVAIILIVAGLEQPRRGSLRKLSNDHSMVYKSDSNDPVAESYYPGIRGSVGPFPIGKREERKKTETYQNRH
jgi:hypothetical protein